MKQTKKEPRKQSHNDSSQKKRKLNLVNISILVLAAALILIVGTQLVLNMPKSPKSKQTSSNSNQSTKDMKKNKYGGYGSYEYIQNTNGTGYVKFIGVPDIKYSYFGNLDNTFSAIFLQDLNTYRENNGLNDLTRVSNISHGETINFEYPNIDKIAVLYGADNEQKLADVVLKKFLETEKNKNLANTKASNIYLNTMVVNNNLTIVVKVAYQDMEVPAPVHRTTHSTSYTNNASTHNYRSNETPVHNTYHHSSNYESQNRESNSVSHENTTTHHSSYSEPHESSSPTHTTYKNADTTHHENLDTKSTSSDEKTSTQDTHTK